MPDSAAVAAAARGARAPEPQVQPPAARERAGSAARSATRSAAEAGDGHPRRPADDGELPRLPRRQARGNQATARCGACHLTLPDGRLQVQAGHGGDHRGRRHRACSSRRARCAASTRTARPSAATTRRPAATRATASPATAGTSASTATAGWSSPPDIHPVGLRHAARAGRAPQHARLLVLPPAADLLHRVPPADGGRVRPDGRAAGGQGRRTRSGPAPASSSSTPRAGRATPPVWSSPPRGRRATPSRPSGTSAPASPATARRAASPATRPTRRGGPTSRRTVPISAGPPAAGSWPPATSAPASSATPSARLSSTANNLANSAADSAEFFPGGAHYT